MRLLFFSFISLLIFVDVSMFNQNSDVRMLFIILIYVYFYKRCELTAMLTFCFTLFLLLITCFQFFFIDPRILSGVTIPFGVEKTAVWAYIFLVIGTVQKLIELTKVRQVKTLPKK